jgi:hypothetical protein
MEGKLSRVHSERATRILADQYGKNLTNHMRLYFNAGKLQSPFWQYWNTVALWRVIWTGENARVIIRARGVGRMYIAASDAWIDGSDFAVCMGQIENPADFDEEQVYFYFRDCFSTRHWIPRPTAMTSDEVDALEYWMEFKCKIEKG